MYVWQNWADHGPSCQEAVGPQVAELMDGHAPPRVHPVLRRTYANDDVSRNLVVALLWEDARFCQFAKSHNSAILTFCHSAILSFCHFAILPFCHSVILPFCQITISPSTCCSMFVPFPPISAHLRPFLPTSMTTCPPSRVALARMLPSPTLQSCATWHAPISRLRLPIT